MAEDCEAVRMWRDKFLLNISSSWKQDVEKTVTDLDLWREILDGWFYFKNGKRISKAPGIKGLLDEYERRSFNKQDAIQQNGSGIHSAEGIPERPQRVLPQLQMPSLLERQRGWQG